jgi:N-carbamoylputrescine amidase
MSANSTASNNVVTLAVCQMACTADRTANVARAQSLIRKAASGGAQIVLVQELFESLYFPAQKETAPFASARDFEGNRLIADMRALARSLNIVLPVSFFERAGDAYFNTVAMIDADGTVLGRYRKSHIPQGPGYEEKHYFAPGDTGFRVWPTKFGRIGVGICWDQWYPECARAMVLKGAEILLYPSAIGNEPHDPAIDSRDHWRRVMQGHAAANMVPLAAANRVGVEGQLTFYGSSFIAGPQGEILSQAPRHGEAIANATFDLGALRARRAAWGLFRDRRPDLYGELAVSR